VVRLLSILSQSSNDDLVHQFISAMAAYGWHESNRSVVPRRVCQRRRVPAARSGRWNDHVVVVIIIIFAILLLPLSEGVLGAAVRDPVRHVRVGE
jgi:hypothetical protein